MAAPSPSMIPKTSGPVAVITAKMVRPPPRTFFRIPGKHHRKRAKSCPEHYIWNGKACVRVKQR